MANTEMGSSVEMARRALPLARGGCLRLVGGTPVKKIVI